jgi:hypothetical protein
MEEIDLCWKFHRAHQKVFYSGTSTIYHVGAGTLGYHSPKKTYLNFKNGLSLLFKHLDTAELIYKFPLRILLDWLAAFQFLLKGDPQNFMAVIKAHFKFLSNLGNDLHKRYVIRKSYPAYSKEMIYARSIVIDYYLKGKKDGYEL